MAGVIRTLPLVVALVAVVGCGGTSSSSKPAKESADRQARPPAGWRTVRNGKVGFTLSIPKGWTAREKGTATLIRSKDRLLVVTVAADRGPEGRALGPAEYARRTVDALPGFEGSVRPREHRVRGSPY